MALFKANDLIHLNDENVTLNKDSDPIELTIKRANEINKKYKAKYNKDFDILSRIEEE